MEELMEPHDYEAMRAMVETLRTRYPMAFPKRSIDVRPLMIGIAQAIVADAPDLPPLVVGRALQLWTTRQAYLEATTVGAARVDLTGAAVGAVTEGEAAFAAARLAKRLEGKRRKAPSPAVTPAADVPRETPPVVAKPPPPQPQPALADSSGRLSLAGLKAAYRQRLAAAGA
jgi:sRNA-binding protein